MKEAIEKAVKATAACCAKEDEDSHQAMQYAQATLNLVNALARLSDCNV